MGFARARTAMVDCQIRPNAVTDFGIIREMSEVPREQFVPLHLRKLAYLDEHLDIGDGRWMISPMRTAQLIQLAGIKPTDVVLDVACGTGYSVAIIAGLASSVFGLDENQSSVDMAAELLSELNIGNAAIVSAPLTGGYKQEAPFDVIVIEGAVEEVPAIFRDQLGEGGRLVCVQPVAGVKTAILYTKTQNALSRREAFHASVPALPGFETAREFRLHDFC